jgi:hypothetical protein
VSETVSADSPRARKAVGQAEVAMAAHLVTSQVSEQDLPARQVTRYLALQQLRHTARRRREAFSRCSTAAASPTTQTASMPRRTIRTRLRDLGLVQQQQAEERLLHKTNPLAARHNCTRRKTSNRLPRRLQITPREINESLAQAPMTIRPSVTVMLNQSRPRLWETAMLRR